MFSINGTSSKLSFLLPYCFYLIITAKHSIQIMLLPALQHSFELTCHCFFSVGSHTMIWRDGSPEISLNCLMEVFRYFHGWTIQISVVFLQPYSYLLLLLWSLKYEISSTLVEIRDRIPRWRITNILCSNTMEVGFQSIIRPGHYLISAGTFAW